MAKSAGRRNAKKTVGRKKRLTNGYKRKTMRKRKRGGGVTASKDVPMLKTVAVEAEAATPRNVSADTDDLDLATEETSHGVAPGSPARTIKLPKEQQSSQLLQSAKYNVEDAGENWFVTIRTEGKKETYSVPKNILRNVNRFTDVTPLG